MTRYPSSADLETFRQSLRRGATSDEDTQHPFRGAWDDELQHGIGYNVESGAHPHTTSRPVSYAIARREASAMRSQAYARRSLSGHPTPPRATDFAERMFGIPAPWRSTTADL